MCFLFKSTIHFTPHSSILWIVIITTAPSIYLAYRIVDRSIFETNARKFIEAEFGFTKTQVINRAFTIVEGKKNIDLLLIGKTLSPGMIDTIKSKMGTYNLDNVELTVRQGLDERSEVDFAAIKASIMKDVLAQADSLGAGNGDEHKDPETGLEKELQALYPGLRRFMVSRGAVKSVDTVRVDSLMLVWMQFDRRPAKGELDKLRAWLGTRLHADSVKLVVE